MFIDPVFVRPVAREDPGQLAPRAAIALAELRTDIEKARKEPSDKSCFEAFLALQESALQFTTPEHLNAGKFAFLNLDSSSEREFVNMGNGGSSDERTRVECSKRLDQELLEQNRQFRAEFHMVMLGSPGSGRSTLFKQCKRLEEETSLSGEHGSSATSCTEARFLFRDFTFLVSDASNLQSERRRWLPCFAGVAAVVFVASLDCYDDADGRMADSIQLFDEIVNYPCFPDSVTVILLLNKADSFAEKIKSVPLAAHFPDYSFDDKPEDEARHAEAFIRSKFLGRTKKRSFAFPICALDEKAFQAVLQEIHAQPHECLAVSFI